MVARCENSNQRIRLFRRYDLQVGTYGNDYLYQLRHGTKSAWTPATYIQKTLQQFMKQIVQESLNADQALINAGSECLVLISDCFTGRGTGVLSAFSKHLALFCHNMCCTNDVTCYYTQCQKSMLNVEAVRQSGKRKLNCLFLSKKEKEQNYNLKKG